MIYTIGETVVDLIFKNMQPQAAKVGGSALNTSVSLGRLGDEVAFISEIGSDELGEWCKSFLQENGVETSYLIEYNDKKTSLALAFLNENNDAKYQFYKEFSAPMPEVSVPFQSSDIVLFSSSFAINSRVRNTVAKFLHRAGSQHALLVYDPNMRKSLAKNSEAYSYVCENCNYADIVHFSDEDAQAIFGISDVNEVFLELKKTNVKVLVFTQNKNDVIVKTNKETFFYNVPQITPVSTIGAGDTFNAGLLHYISKRHVTKGDLDSISSDFFDEAIPFAISCAGNVCRSIDNYVDVQFAARVIRK